MTAWGRQARPAVVPFPGGPLRNTKVYPTVADALADHRGPASLPLLFPGSIHARAAEFADGFPGRVLYAVKSNPHPAVLRAIFQAGVRDFDIASLAELRMVRRLGDGARAHFMHPIKAREALREAYACGVRTFVVDSDTEVTKIYEELSDPDLLILVRLVIPNGHAAYQLTGKFGADPDDAVGLLQLVASRFKRVGICFHVGSQCLEPEAYKQAVDIAAAVAERSGVPIRVVDVGGGFPARYPGVNPPPNSAFFDVIGRALAGTTLEGARLWAEPGRALVADGGATLVRVEDRRRRELHLNDGVFGTLFDTGTPAWQFPVQLQRKTDAPLVPFRAFGPSCDSADTLTHPLHLPEDIREGDWLEFGQLGAYSTAFQSRFNGFRPATPVAVLDKPLLDRVEQS